ncbi:TrbC/VirB2 family protein [Methylorubrum extorquens]|jgi:type IV secretory pathway VirB2 component (pilin)|uniref:TrbC/VirB2 family protein n=1 Tax=Methylorubrum extorquens TaxID=408 RepID=A0AAX3WN00_METEX|nr:TrbC/VirB2 family protein [Methylorubrum extorquens]WHQ72930.1 TrbC/VirB2 family protein [Methylorubrum extorquens]
MTHARRHAAFLVSASVLLAFTMVEPAAAQSLGGVEKVLQNIVDALTGNVAKLLATIAVIVVGMAWMFGYLDLRKAGYVIFGVAILFGASEIVSTITGK